MAINTDTEVEGLCSRDRDERGRTWWAWYPGVFEAMADNGARKVVFPPKPGSREFSQTDWTVIMSSPVDRRGEAPMRISMTLGDLLTLCGVEACCRAMVFAHQRAVVDAKRLATDLARIAAELDPRQQQKAEQVLGQFRGMETRLERQLAEAGEFVPKGSSRIGGDADPRAAAVVDLDRYRRLRRVVIGHLMGVPDELRDDPAFDLPEHYCFGLYASRAGGPQDREVFMVGSAGHWVVADALLEPMGEDHDVDYRCLPDPFDDRTAAIAEGRRQFALAVRNGGPSEDFDT